MAARRSTLINIGLRSFITSVTPDGVLPAGRTIAPKGIAFDDSPALKLSTCPPMGAAAENGGK